MMELNKEKANKVYKEIGERIFRLRSMRGYTRENLAELTGISAKFLYEIENGKKGFSVAVLFFLGKALQVDAGYILTGKEDLGCDEKLVATLELFKNEQAESIDLILKEIHKLLLLK